MAYAPKELADSAGVSVTTVHNEIDEGNLKARKLGSRTLILREDALEWLRSLPLRDVAGRRAEASASASAA
jgi:excisionase family DNA binding protein